MIIDEKNHLAHYGILRRSGRYPWGSGGPEFASNKGFLGMVEGLRKEGLSETEIARGLGITTTQLRAAKSIAKNEQKQADIAMAQRLKEKGMSNVAIGERMKINESSVRALLAPGQRDKADVLASVSGMLKDQVAEKKYVDIGAGVEHHIGVSDTKLSIAVARLKEEGYKVHNIKIPQLGTGKMTNVTVLAGPESTFGEVVRNRDQIKQIASFSDDGGRTFLGIHPPKSLDSKRVAIRYAEQGGAGADGVIYVRPGVPDVSLGGSRYAQVRIAVDGSHYLKGMAMYKDDLPDGVDVMFNTNKSSTGNKLDAMKPLKADKNGKIDEDNPFGAVIKPGGQITTRDAHGNIKVTSVMNKVNEEGDWEKWSKSLSSQFLSKQSPALAKTQLNMTLEKKRNELDEILKLTNPSVKKKLLEAYADSADSSAVHLKAHHLSRQGSHVILPINSMKENEIYAPNFRPGETVVLIRYPHGGVFEIPELKVNNRQPEARRLLGSAKDAVGINPKVAEKLSGADFDGDTVLVIPNNNRLIKTAPSLAGLKNFDPRSSYPAYEGMPRMTAREKGIQMGVVSNLITDMTIRGASTSELAQAVRHSMVVIDAEKHNLNWKQSAIDNGIAHLKEKYQGGARAGASTLISRAGAEIRVPDRKPRSSAKGGPVDRETGRKVFENTGATRIMPDGKAIPKMLVSKKLAETDDASTLSSGTPIEKIYADHSNNLKALANRARKEAANTRSIGYSSSARNVYSNEVDSLSAKLNLALRNAPLERQAQILANAVFRKKKQEFPDMEPSDIKKVKAQALNEARTRTGAKKTDIEITDSEWAAIQAGAITPSRLNQILNHADLDRVKQLASPRTATVMTNAKKQRALAMFASGYTQAEIADALGVSLSTLKRSVGGDEE